MRLKRYTTRKSIANKYHRMMRTAGLSRVTIKGYRGKYEIAGTGDASSVALFATAEAIIDRELRPHAYT